MSSGLIHCAHRRRGDTKSKRSLTIRKLKSLPLAERPAARNQKPWARRRISQGIRGHESPIRQKRARTRRNRRQRRHNRVRTRQNPVFHQYGGEPVREPTAGIGARMIWRYKPNRRKRRDGTNVRHAQPPDSGTYEAADGRIARASRKCGSRCIAG